MDYFEFLETLKMGDEILTSATGDRIHKVIGINDNHIVIDSGTLFERRTGQAVPKKKNDIVGALLELTTERRKAIEEAQQLEKQQEEEEAEKRRTFDLFNSLTGGGYSYKAPSVEIQKAVIELIQKMK